MTVDTRNDDGSHKDCRLFAQVMVTDRARENEWNGVGAVEDFSLRFN